MKVMIERVAGGSRDGIDTHLSTYFQRIWRQVAPHHEAVIIDPFARNCPLATHSNDKNPETKAQFHLDALDFLKMIDDESADFVIFDPPFSPRQDKEKYEGETVNVYTRPGYVPDLMKEIIRFLRTGGQVLKFGYNTSCHHIQLDLERIWVVNEGGNRNDVLVSLWRKSQRTLREWC